MWKKLLRLVTVVRAVGDVFIVSVGVIKVGETMIGKDVGKLFVCACVC